MRQQAPTFLLTLPDVSVEYLPTVVKDYIVHGENQGFNKGYKCRIRKRWYIVPSVWTPDAFMLRQVHHYPKLALNAAASTCTDTIHRVRLRNDPDGRQLVAGFLNSLTFAFSEIIGRSYGGGVLELEPNEAEQIPMSLVGADRLDINEIDHLLRKENIYAVLDTTDRILLKEGLGLDDPEIKLIRNIWEKLRDRRNNRKHQNGEKL